MESNDWDPPPESQEGSTHETEHEPAAGEPGAEAEQAAADHPDSDHSLGSRTAEPAAEEMEDSPEVEPTEGASLTEEPTASPTLHEMMMELLRTTRDGFEGILTAFERKLAYDAAKERQVDRLHEELQGHRSNLVGKIAEPLINGIIRLHDQVGQLVEALQKEGQETLDADRVFKLLRYQEAEVEALLDNHGISTYSVEGDVFDPRRQQALETVSTDEEIEHGRIVDHVRKGFERGDVVVRKEKVRVAKYRPPEPGEGVPAADEGVPAAQETPPSTAVPDGPPTDEPEETDRGPTAGEEV